MIKSKLPYDWWNKHVLINTNKAVAAGKWQDLAYSHTRFPNSGNACFNIVVLENNILSGLCFTLGKEGPYWPIETSRSKEKILTMETAILTMVVRWGLTHSCSDRGWKWLDNFGEMFKAKA